MACMFPITIINPASSFDLSAMRYIPVPCGKCPACISKRSNGWIFRLMEEDKVSDNATFCTFTYENKYFTKSSGRLTPKGYMSLVKYDFQNFMKSLRNSFRYRARNPKTGKMRYCYDKVPKIKYYMCGEYGSETYRPHYHAIIFGVDRSIIARHWTFGVVHLDDVNGNTVAYTTKYMNKGKVIPVHAGDDRLPEFQCASLSLGRSYVTPETIKYHNDDLSRMYLTSAGGVKVPMPRYYRDKLFDDTAKKKHARLVQSQVLHDKEKKIREFSQDNPDDNYYRVEVERKKAALAAYRARLKERKKL